MDRIILPAGDSSPRIGIGAGISFAHILMLEEDRQISVGLKMFDQMFPPVPGPKFHALFIGNPTQEGDLLK